MAASGGKCTTCKTDNGLFQNPATAVTLGNECILCSDAKGADGVTGVANCNTCTASGSAGPATCSACQEGYFLSGQTCIQCNNACATCETSATQCTSCPEGKYLKDGNTCVEPSQCAGANYPDKQSGQCKACSTIDTNCGTCEYNDAAGKGKCTDCGSKKVKTALDGTTTCVDVATGCTDANHFKAESDAAYYLCRDNTQDQTEANKGTANCKTCTKNNAKPVCSACLEGYYDSGSSGTVTCTACTGTNCATCKDASNKCASCKPGFFLKDASSGECVSCDNVDKGGREGCSACSNTNTFKCADCRANYRKQQNGGAVDDYTCTRICRDSKGHCPPPPSRRGQSSLYITTNCKPSRRRRSRTGCWGTRALDTPRTRRCSTGGRLSWHRCRQEVD
ncbi:Hypothetical protein GSB_155179 [Giardia duodenalis]|uniref:EGF-like domain-containing protein n=1 Tax=Giardia intestinalis TaxID=5741 RepID=V6TNC7_GIAIN|nr:Hypothetical protein GSB_155179 [Giardia intestinalis]